MPGKSPEVTRFAPSPTGPSAYRPCLCPPLSQPKRRLPVAAFSCASRDIDLGRTQETFVDAIFTDLSWLGLTWETPVRRQSAHFTEYDRALQRLRDAHVLYPCFCTRADIRREIGAAAAAPHGPDGPIYPGTCRDKSQSESAALTDGVRRALCLAARMSQRRWQGRGHWRGTIALLDMWASDAEIFRRCRARAQRRADQLPSCL